MQLTLWTYEGPPHIGAMRIATAMDNVHYVLHAPQGDTYADLLFTMIERMRERSERLVVILISGRPMIITEQLAQVDAFVAAWLPPPDVVRSLPNLKAIFSLGAGVDAILKDPTLPKDVPIVRVNDADLTGRMTEYVVLHVLLHHRQFQPDLLPHARHTWDVVAGSPREALVVHQDRRVGGLEGRRQVLEFLLFIMLLILFKKPRQKISLRMVKEAITNGSVYQSICKSGFH